MKTKVKERSKIGDGSARQYWNIFIRQPRLREPL